MLVLGLLIIGPMAGNVQHTDYNIIEEEKTFTTSAGSKYALLYFQVSGLQNISLQDKINQNLMDIVNFCELNVDECEVMQDIVFSLKAKNRKYLSVLYELALDAENGELVKNGSIRIGLTVSMESGERIFLDDLIEFDKAYSEYQNLRETATLFSSPLSSDEFESIFELASVSELEYIDSVRLRDNLADQFLISYLRVKPTFFIDSDKITIITSPYTLDDISLAWKPL